MKKLFTLLTLALLSIGSVQAQEVTVGRTVPFSADATEYTVASDENAVTTIYDGEGETGTGKGGIYYKTTSATMNVTCYRSQYDGKVPTALNENVYAGIKIVIPEGKKMEVAKIEVSVAVSNLFTTQVIVYNENGGALYTSGTKAIEDYNKSSAKNLDYTITPPDGLTLTGTVYVRMHYWYSASTSSNSKYIVPLKLNVTGTIEDYVATNWDKPTFTLGAYDGSKYSVTIESQEGTTLKYTVGDSEEATSETNTQVVSAAPGTMIKATATGGDLADSEEATYEVPAEPAVAAPTITAISYDYVKGSYAVTITSNAEGSTVYYKVGSGEYTDVAGAVVYVQAGAALTIKASKNGYKDSEVTVGTFNAAPSSTSPETLIPFFGSTDTYDSDKEHNYVSVSIPGAYVAGVDEAKGLKFRCSGNATNIEGIGNNALSLNVNNGYKVTGVKIKIRSNYAGTIAVPNMYIDGEAVEGFEKFDIPGNSSEYLEKAFTNLNATSEIAWKLEPTSGATQYRATIEITYIPTTPETKEVTEYGWATYIPAYAAKFNEGDAYVITDVNDEAVIIENVTEVPANTAVLLKGKGEKTITFIESATPLENENLLKVCEGTEVEGKTAYVLAKDGDSAGFKKWSGEISALAGRAVLWLGETQAAARGFFALDGETTGIKSVATSVEDGAVYDLQGRRVAQPKAGLYIVNGKKVIVK